MGPPLPGFRVWVFGVWAFWVQKIWPEGSAPSPKLGCLAQVGHDRGPAGWGAQKCCAFFPSPTTIFFLSSLSWGSSRGILVVFLKAGVSLDSPRTPNVHILGPHRFRHHQNSTRRPQEREKKERKLWWESEKKAKIWAVLVEGGPGRGRSWERASPLHSLPQSPK